MPRTPVLALLAVLLAAIAVPAAQPTATMKAIRYHAYGGPEVLKLEDAPKPAPAAGEVLVKVHAASVNPVDWKMRAGKFARGAAKFPVIPGFDVSGVVESVGDGVTSFKAGDEVYGYLSLGRGGAYAQYVAAPASEFAAKPKTIDHAHAAAVPLAALTAWQAMFDTAKLQPGQTVLIHAAAGGVGHFAVQLAKAKGARVIATASAANAEFLKELGADVVIDYKVTKFEDVAKDVDVVLDSIGGDTLERSYGVVKTGGFIVSIVAQPSVEKLAARGLKGTVMLVKPNGAQLAEIGALIDAAKVKPHVSAQLPLEDAAKAHEMSETGRTRGKIVLVVQ